MLLLTLINSLITNQLHMYWQLKALVCIKIHYNPKHFNLISFWIDKDYCLIDSKVF